MNISPSKFWAVSFTVLIVTLVTGYAVSVFLTSLGVDPILCAISGFGVGYFLPGRLFKWILKEEIEEFLAQQREDQEPD